MNTTSVYLLTIPGNPPIEIPRDELRSLLAEIEAQLHRSKVYRSALGTLQQMLGSSAEQAKGLFKAVSREAIALAFQQFAIHHQEVTNISLQTDVTGVSPSVEPEDSSNSSQPLTSVKSHAQESVKNTSVDNLPSQVDTKADLAIKPESKFTTTVWKKWLNHHQKPSITQQKQQTVTEEYAINLRQIGQQFQEVRESKGWSLIQLKEHTHIPIYHLDALENGNVGLLPEEIFVRGFIRVIGNALGLNGTALAASLPKPEIATSQAALPSWCQAQKATGGLGLEIRPMHLYVGYTALVAGAVGGLSLVSSQVNSEKTLHVDVDSQPASSLPKSTEKREATAKPGLKSGSTRVIVGPDISPPEAL
ncbi:MAG: helix-turn-helix domain-containing protein [Aulosira sp. DedQUE10]|nr:helix-turn-helix domain-containing protein [Aulosira sp. DedQUE10]